MTWMTFVFCIFFPPLILFQIQDGSWHQSRFFFHTQDSRQLPIVDIQEFPPSQPNSQRHIEISPVCFLWQQRLCHVTYLHELLKCKAVTKNGCLPKSECPLHFVMETVNGTCQQQMSNRRQIYMEELKSLWNIQDKKAKGEKCIPIFITNCVSMFCQ